MGSSYFGEHVGEGEFLVLKQRGSVRDGDSNLPLRDVLRVEEFALSRFESLVVFEEIELDFSHSAHHLLESSLFERVELVEANAFGVNEVGLDVEELAPRLQVLS